MDRFHNGDPIGVTDEYETVHEAAFDVFVTSHKHGRQLWFMHFHGGVPLAESYDEMTRAQAVVIQKLQDHWSEKAKEQGKSRTPNTSNLPSNARF